MSLIVGSILFLAALAGLTANLMDNGAKFNFALVGALLQINWFFVGFFFWTIYMLAASFGLFVEVAHYVFTKQSYKEGQEYLEKARKFWVAGFRDIYSAITNPAITESAPKVGEGRGFTVFFIIVSLAFWVIIILSASKMA